MIFILGGIVGIVNKLDVELGIIACEKQPDHSATVARHHHQAPYAGSHNGIDGALQQTFAAHTEQAFRTVVGERT